MHMSNKKQLNFTDLKDVVGELDKFTKLNTDVDKFSFKFKLDNRVVSDVQFLIYFVNKDGEIVSSSTNIVVEKCLTHSVSFAYIHYLLNLR